MNYESRLELSFYRDLAPISEEHGVSLVRHIETGKIFVKKVRSVYHIEVFQRLREQPIDGIPRIYCLHEEGNTLTLIEEYIPGDTLAERLGQGGPADENTAVCWALELCEILSRLHGLKPPVIHRDIKPSNVIITPENRVFLIDLDAARPDIIKEEDTVLLGTKGYAAPEQYGFGSSNVQTDIYALGMLMNTMLAGQFRHEPVKNSRLTKIIENCTQIDPEKRYPDVRTLKKALEKEVKLRPAESLYTPRSFLPPGFRSGIAWHMLAALPVYLLVFFFSLTFEAEGASGGVLILYRVFCLTFSLAMILCTAGYLNVQKLIPLCRSERLWVRFSGIALLDLSVGLILFFLFLLAVMIFF